MSKGNYYQLGRSQLLHIAPTGEETNTGQTLCWREINETSKLANDVENAPICTLCLRKFNKRESEK